MSRDIAIRAEGLGKRYQKGSRLAKHDSLRDALKESVGSLFRGQPRDEEGSSSFWALRDASFEIARGENVGIIGLNGAGKSTLLKVLSRITTPTTGTARLVGRMGALIEVGTGFHAELTGRENTFLYGAILGMSREEVARKFDAIVAFSEIGEFIDTPVKRYSSGMYVRLAFAVAAHLDPDILLLDEVLAVGDFTFQKKCMDFAHGLERKGATILFVSHNMFSIKAMCQRVIYLRKGQVVFDGPTDDGLRIYEADCRLATSPWFGGSDAERPIVITDVTISGADGAEKSVFNHGERMRVRARYEAKRPIANADFRVGMNRSDEVHCCSYSTAADGIRFDAKVGEGTIELDTPPLKLAADMYTLTFAVRERHEQLLAQLGTTFHIRHATFASAGYGVFHEPGRWSLGAETQPALVQRRAS